MLPFWMTVGSKNNLRASLYFQHVLANHLELDVFVVPVFLWFFGGSQSASSGPGVFWLFMLVLARLQHQNGNHSRARQRVGGKHSRNTTYFVWCA